jgi:tetratricopeptide (TPR) repeat protein
MAFAEEARGLDGTPWFDKALSAFDEAGKKDPAYWKAAANKASLLEDLGRYDEAAGTFESVLKISGRAGGPVKQDLDRVRRILALPPWLRTLSAAWACISRGAYPAARLRYEKGLADAEKAGAYRDPRYHPNLSNAHVNLACILSRASAGFRTPKAAPAPVDSGEAVFLKTEAVAHLRAALELGWKDVDYFGKEADLESLRGFPAFEALVEKWKKKG